MQQPQVILADEPVAALDPRAGREDFTDADVAALYEDRPTTATVGAAR